MRTRLHLLGASGSGTTTLGRAVATRLGAAFLDTDDFEWLPTEAPYRSKRDAANRVRLLEAALARQRAWVLAGSLCGWGDVFTPTSSSSSSSKRRPPSDWRGSARARARYGESRLARGGDMHAQHDAFLAWAATYDVGAPEERSLRLHEEWLRRVIDPARVVRLDSTRPVPERVEAVARHDGRAARVPWVAP